MPKPLRVLLVDDDPDDRALVLRELRKEFGDVEATEVTESRELRETLDGGAFDLVITDYQLRWTDGVKVVTAIKARRPDCPAIMFTATGSEEVAVEGMKSGLDDYVIKSVHHLVRLRAAVRSVLQQSQTRRRVVELEKRLETLLAQLNVGVFRYSVEGTLLEANEAFLRLLGYSSLEVARGSLPSESLLRHEVCAPIFNALLQTAEPQDREVQLSRADGGSFWIRLSAVLSTTPDGQMVIDGLVEDITPRKRAEEENHARAAAAGRLKVLTPREHEVLEFVVSGHANKNIASDLGISEKTVEKHRANLMDKLGVQSVAELVRLAIVAEPQT